MIKKTLKNIAKLNPETKSKETKRINVKFLGDLPELKMLKNLDCQITYNQSLREINLYKEGEDTILKSFDIDAIRDSNHSKGGFLKGGDKVELKYDAFILKLEMKKMSGLDLLAKIHTWSNMESKLTETIASTVDSLTNHKAASNVFKIGKDLKNSLKGAEKKDTAKNTDDK